MASKPLPRGRRALRLGKYELFSPTRTWDREAVYKAVDVESGKEVAVKILAPEVSGDEDFCRRLKEEAAQAASLQHPQILGIRECGEANGTWYLAMELVEGVFLSERVKKEGPLSRDLARRFLAQSLRALDHARQQDFLPPDTSPAGFLVTAGNHFKLIPLQLLLQNPDSAAYQAPELHQRGGGTPDIRSALFSLGGTFYFALTGRPPGQSLRLDKVPADFQPILSRLLAKSPEERYQTPAEPLEELGLAEEEEEESEAEDQKSEARNQRPEVSNQRSEGTEEEIGVQAKKPSGRAQRDTLAELASLETEEPSGTEPSEVGGQRSEVKPPARKVGLSFPLPADRTMVYLMVSMAGVILILGLVIVILATRSGGEQRPSPNNAKGPAVPPPVQKPEVQPEEKPDNVKPAPDTLEIDPKVHKEFEGPWSNPLTIPANAPVLWVSRAGVIEGVKGPVYRTLGGACAAALPGEVTVIEIHDNGPLFEIPIAVKGRSLAIRAGANFRPLLVWDLEKWKKGVRGQGSGVKGQGSGVKGLPAALLSLERGNLWLGGIDLALDWPAEMAVPACLVRLVDGEFLTWQSSFSLAGNSKAGVTVLRFEAKPGQRCRFSQCCVRGANFLAVDLQGTAPEVMLDNCLLAGGDGPLIRSQAAAEADKVPTLRLVRSTFLARNEAIHVQPADPAKSPLQIMAWDTFLVRSGKGPGGTMIALPAEAGPEVLKWRGINCLFAGWKTLLSGNEAPADQAAWQRQFSFSQGDKVLPNPWPPLSDAVLPHLPPTALALEKTPWAVPATFGKGLVGCDVNQLFWRANWEELAYQGFRIPPVTVLKDSTPPKIPEAKDGRYYGGRLDLSKKDIAQHLRDMEKKQQLGQAVVLHLSGSGRRKIKPVHLQGKSLTLYFEPPPSGKEHLVLVPDGADPNAGAFFQMEGGNLEIIGGEIRCPEGAAMSHYLISVQKGNLRVHGCQLCGPLARLPDSYWGLIRLRGSGLPDPKLVYGATFHETILESGRVGLHLAGTGLRLRIEQSLFVSGSDALHFQPGAVAPPALNVQCTMENTTVAARQAIVYVEDVPAWSVLADPVILQTKANVFLNPFQAGKDPAPAALLVYQGTALPRGVLACQGRWDVIDPRLNGVLPAGANGKAVAPGKTQPASLWQDLWGAFGCRDPLLNLAFKNTITLDNPLLGLLAFTGQHPFLSPGANFKRLGIFKK